MALTPTLSWKSSCRYKEKSKLLAFVIGLNLSHLLPFEFKVSGIFKRKHPLVFRDSDGAVFSKMFRLDDICAVSVVNEPFVFSIPNAVNVDCAVF